MHIDDIGYVLLDTETTGLNPREHATIELGAKILTPDLELHPDAEPFLTLIKPIAHPVRKEAPVAPLINPRAIEINGHNWVYTPVCERYRSALSPLMAWMKFNEWLRRNFEIKNNKRVVAVGWNTNFDMQFIKRLFRGHYLSTSHGHGEWTDDSNFEVLDEEDERSLRWPFHYHPLDLMAVSRYLDIRNGTKRPGYSLERLASSLFPGAADLAMHTAMGDADMSLRVVRSIEEDYRAVHRRPIAD
jgi:hypothetical protein